MKADLNIKGLIDQLGRIRAKQADLALAEDAIKDQLGGLLAGAHDGKLFRCTISEYDREVFDVKAARRRLGPAWVRRHTRKVPVRNYLVTARNAARNATRPKRRAA